MVRTQSVSLLPAFPHLTFSKPVLLTHAPGLPDHVFIVQQNGTILVVDRDSSTRTARTFLNIGGRLSSPGGEQGLLGLAFHPNFASNGTFFVNYTAPTSPPNNCRTVVARYTVVPGVPDSADPASEVRILEIEQPYSNHNGGMIAFGPDGYLYIGMGDGGDGNDPGDVAQNLSVLLGKILRIDVDHTTDPLPYAIPPDNPYRNNPRGYREEIWASGFRNPWRFSIDPTTGEIWVGDVGQGAREEIDLVVKGGNYGWKIMEGTICRPPTTGCSTIGLELPVKDYPRSLGYSVTGGFVYRGTRRPELHEAYVYGDYGSGRVWQLRRSGGVVTVDSLLIDTPYAISGFGTDSDQELYILSYSSTQPSTIYWFNTTTPTTVTPSPEAGPDEWELNQNFPNPCNPSTTITFSVGGRASADFARGVTEGGKSPAAGSVNSRAGLVRLSVYDLLGREVAVLVDETLAPGRHQVIFNATGLASGVYLYRLAAGPVVRSRKLAVIR